MNSTSYQFLKADKKRFVRRPLGSDHVSCFFCVLFGLCQKQSCFKDGDLKYSYQCRFGSFVFQDGLQVEIVWARWVLFNKIVLNKTILSQVQKNMFPCRL